MMRGQSRPMEGGPMKCLPRVQSLLKTGLVSAQGAGSEWVMSPTPIFHLQSSTETKGIISQCYQMLLTQHLQGAPH